MERETAESLGIVQFFLKTCTVPKQSQDFSIIVNSKIFLKEFVIESLRFLFSVA